MKLAVIGDNTQAEKATSYFNDLGAHAVQFKTVKRVHKRFLNPAESIEGRSRLADLFRVVKTINPESILEKQRENNPDVFDRLDEEMITAMKVQMEGFEDFDLVIDTTACNQDRGYVGNGYLALGEEVLKDKINYGKIIEDYSFNGFTELALVHDDEASAKSLINLTSDIIEKKCRVFIITESETPFLSISNELKTKLDESLALIQKALDKDIALFEEKLTDWNKLEDYEKAKVMRPAEPIPFLVYFAGHSVTSIDRLVDQKRFFLTIEIPEWKKPTIQKENATIELKTIGVEDVFIYKSNRAHTELYNSLLTSFTPDGIKLIENENQHREDGFYSIFPEQSIDQSLKTIEKNIMSYFTKA